MDERFANEPRHTPRRMRLRRVGGGGSLSAWGRHGLGLCRSDGMLPAHPWDAGTSRTSGEW